MMQIPNVTPQILSTLAYPPLQYMLRAAQENPLSAMVYTDHAHNPCTAAVRIGRILFFGGQPSLAFLHDLKERILTAEVCEKYGLLYFYYPDVTWQAALSNLYPRLCTPYTRTLYTASPKECTGALLPAEIRPITDSLLKSGLENTQIITDEITTYPSLAAFLHTGIGYTLIQNGAVQGFCTSEYQSTHEIAVGIEVLPHFRKKGFAKVMTSAFLCEAGHRHLTVYWECWADNTPSVHTALSCGFKHTADYPMLVADLHTYHRRQAAPPESDILPVLQHHLPDAQTAKRVPQGASTFVYRITTPSRTVYARFLPEDGHFAPEMRVHSLLLKAGVSVPAVLAFEKYEQTTGLSMMVTAEIPGYSMEDRWPAQHADRILAEAGRQLAIIHTLPVDGFGWINRHADDALTGMYPDFRSFFTANLDDDLCALRYYNFTPAARRQITDCMREALDCLEPDAPVLVHGDFDKSHIFHNGSHFTGFIDFGEIRGHHRLYDLATFALFDATPDRTAFKALLDGYRSAAPWSMQDMRRVDLLGLSIALRFAAKKLETRSRSFWQTLLYDALARL